DPAAVAVCLEQRSTRADDDVGQVAAGLSLQGYPTLALAGWDEDPVDLDAGVRPLEFRDQHAAVWGAGRPIDDQVALLLRRRHELTPALRLRGTASRWRGIPSARGGSLRAAGGQNHRRGERSRQRAAQAEDAANPVRTHIVPRVDLQPAA